MGVEPIALSSAPRQAPAAQPVRVVLVDGHAFFRRGLRKLLEQDAIEVAGEASDGARAIALVQDAAPDVVLMDVALAGISGIQAARQIRAVSPASRVIMLTPSADERDVEDSIRAGACGYLLKDAPVEQILTAIRGAAVGESHLSPRVAAGLVERVRAEGPRPPAADELSVELTKREREVLRLMADGRENGQIADELFISVQTVKKHASSIFAKLEVENRVQAAVQAFRSRLL